MPFTEPSKGSAFILKADVSGTMTIVEGINKYNKQRSRSSTSTQVFNNPDPWSITQPVEEKYSVSGLHVPADPGQMALRDAEVAGDTINIQCLYDGTKGFAQPVKVTSFTHDATPEGFQEITYEFIANGARTAVASGELL